MIIDFKELVHDTSLYITVSAELRILCQGIHETPCLLEE